jgi:uncharacterized MnhB-related membrane protein
MEMITMLFDGILCLVLFLVAWQSLFATELFKAIVLFITFGLLMALSWVRLNAVDVAIAEAAIGAGLTGALMLAALAKLQKITHNDKTPNHSVNSKNEERKEH